MTNIQNDKPDFMEYHKSIAAELKAVKNRIRNLVRHWPTDGGWKEIVLRSILRKHLPESCIVGQGFIVGKDKVSSQIDVLVASKDQPTLFKDGDLLIVTPSAVRAIVEVKTRLRRNTCDEAFRKIANNTALCGKFENSNVWTGIFDFDSSYSDEFCEVLLKASKRAKDSEKVPINSIACGTDLFIRYWKNGERPDDTKNLWRSYRLKELAPAYFVGNLIDHIASIDNSSNSFAWFPIEGTKEVHKTYEIRENEDEPRDLSALRA